MGTCCVFPWRRRVSAAPIVLALGLQAFVATALPAAGAREYAEHTTAWADEQTPGIDSGFLIVDNRYVAPPYRIEHDGEQLRVNGIELALPDAVGRFPARGHFPARPGARDRRAVPSMRRYPHRESSARDALIQAERLFLRGGLVIRFTDGALGVFPHADSILGPLLSDLERTDKLRSLMSHSRQPISFAQWSALVDGFERDDGLRERVFAIEHAGTAAAAPLHQPPQYALYGLTVLGMILTVACFGIVLSHRPQHFCRWSDVNRIPRDVRLVIGCAAMIAVLCVFDLVCTLTAAHTMHFWEINPFGAPLVAQPAVLSAAKLLLTFVCVGILWRLRFYRGAQLASWWLCLGLTLLTARWVVFNSLLLA